MRHETLTAIVSGGASGLGAATVSHLRSLGARVGVLDRDMPRIECDAHVQIDVTEAQAVGDAFDTLVSSLGATPRLVVNCAGIAPAARVVQRDGVPSTKLFAQVVGVNLIGTFNVMAHAVRHMKAVAAEGHDGQRGLIVNTASIAYEDGQIGQTAYAASKGGVAAMTLPAARELARDGIRVMAVAPGLFRTPMMEGLPEDVTERIAQGIPYPQRLGDPLEYAKLVVQILENTYLNGSVVRLDGAVRLAPR
ncbi:MAG: SDR family NAD(P)-dependent oxidoreductase [Shimia sp.]